MKNTKIISIPSLSEIDTAYAALERKRLELIADQSKAQKQLDDIFSELTESNRSPKQLERDNRVANLYG